MKAHQRQAAIFSSPLTYTQKIVLLAMASFMGENREQAWPSIGTLKQMTSLGERSVQGVIKAGLKAGWLVEDLEAGRRTRSFSINWERLQEPATPAADAPPPQEMRPAGDAGTPAGDAPYPAARAPNPAAAAPEPYRTIQEPTKNHPVDSGAKRKPPTKPKPKPKATQEAEQGLAMLAAVRTEHHKATTGRAIRGRWGAPETKTGEKLVRQVAGYLRELREAELGEPPLDVLQAVARWVYLGPNDFFRRRPDPLGSMLGGNPTTRQARAVEALDWHQQGCPSNAPARSPSRGRGRGRGHDSYGAALEELTQPQSAPARKVINPEVAP